jgi:DNA modification methylase
MSPRLAKRLIAEATTVDDVVLDPMAGSGTVPAAALALGRTCLAMDIDPLARLAIRVQCGAHDIAQVEKTGARALEIAESVRKDIRGLDQIFARRFDTHTQEFIKRWFPTRVRRGLLALWEAISTAMPASTRPPLKIAFSRLIIAKTAGTSHAIDLPHTRPHFDDEKVVPDPLQMFPRRLAELTSRMKERLAVKGDATLHLRAGDARRLPYKDASADFVLTSSPYANAIDYMRAHKFSLVWMGYAIPRLAEIRGQMIGTEQGLTEFDSKLHWIDSRLPKPKPKTRHRIAIFRRFFADMHLVISELHRVLRPGGACAFVLGSSYMCGSIVDTPAVIAETAQRCGFSHITTVFRDVNPHRRSLPFPRAAGRSVALAKRMHQEAVVVLGR